MKGSRQLYLFRRIKFDGTVISYEDTPFPHIRVSDDKSFLMLPIEELLNAGRMIDGLGKREREVIKSMLATFAS